MTFKRLTDLMEELIIKVTEKPADFCLLPH